MYASLRSRLSEPTKTRTTYKGIYITIIAASCDSQEGRPGSLQGLHTNFLALENNLRKWAVTAFESKRTTIDNTKKNKNGD